MNTIQVVIVMYAGRFYKATVIEQGYYVGALNVILPFRGNGVLSIAA